MDPISVRPPDANDVAAMAAIYNDVVATSTAIHASQPSTLAERRDGSAPHGSRLSGAGGASAAASSWAIASFAEFRGAWPGYLHSVEHSVYVRADCRRQGVGSALVRLLLPLAAAMDKHVMIGGIDALPTSGSLLHARASGFQRVAHFREVGRKVRPLARPGVRAALHRRTERATAHWSEGACVAREGGSRDRTAPGRCCVLEPRLLGPQRAAGVDEAAREGAASVSASWARASALSAFRGAPGRVALYALLVIGVDGPLVVEHLVDHPHGAGHEDRHAGVEVRSAPRRSARTPPARTPAPSPPPCWRGGRSGLVGRAGSIMRVTLARDWSGCATIRALAIVWNWRDCGSV